MAMTHDPTGLSESADAGALDQADPAGPEVSIEAAPARAEGGATVSWAEREIVDSLHRLARAQAQLAAAEEQAAVAADQARFDEVDAERLEQVHAELLVARERASGRFAKGSVRQRVGELEMAERLVLERLGAPSYEEFRAKAARASSRPAADPDVVAFARRELEAAKSAWLEAQSIEIPPPPDIDLT
jgi:hypothetical protein